MQRKSKTAHQENYQVAIWKRALENFPEIPKPIDGHVWMLNESGDIEPLWCENNILPEEFVDLLAQPDDDESDDNDSDVYESEYSSESDEDSD